MPRRTIEIFDILGSKKMSRTSFWGTKFNGFLHFRAPISVYYLLSCIIVKTRSRSRHSWNSFFSCQSGLLGRILLKWNFLVCMPCWVSPLRLMDPGPEGPERASIYARFACRHQRSEIPDPMWTLWLRTWRRWRRCEGGLLHVPVSLSTYIYCEQPTAAHGEQSH
jgi:hypothetical protein